MKDSNYRNLGYIYLINAVGTEYFKIGSSRCSVINRLLGLQTGCPIKLRYVYHTYVKDMFFTEKELHKIFSLRRTIGEWFRLSQEDVKKCITLMRLMQVSEFTINSNDEILVEKPVEEKSFILEDYISSLNEDELKDEDDSEEYLFTSLNLTKSAATQLVLKLRYESPQHNQTEIIWMLWNAKPGTSRAYKKALKEYKDLTKDDD